MTVIIPPGYGQFTLIYTGPMFVSGGGATVLGFGGPGEIEATLPEFAEDLVERWNSTIRTLTDSNLRLERIHWAGPTTSGDVPAGIAGAQSRASIAPNVATLVSYTTSRKGRRGRGRSYLPGLLAQTEVGEDGVLAQTKRDQIQAQVDAFLPTLAPVVPQVILQRDEPDQVTPPLAQPPIVTGVTVGGRAASQRRRLRR